MKRILLVDDDDGFRNILAHVLRSKGHEVTVVINGEEAWNLLRECNVFDHIISDNDMPQMSGLELLREVRFFLPHNKATPFMLLSGLEQSPNGVKLADMCAGLGAKFFLKGSFVLGDLIQEIR